MTNKKKVTIKHFLNKSVTGFGAYHPLYVMVTYNRRNTQFKSVVTSPFQSLDEAKKDFHWQLTNEERIIKMLVEYEARRLEEKFEIKGIGNKYGLYRTLLIEILNNYLNDRLLGVAMECASSRFYDLLYKGHTDGEEFQIMYEAAERLFDDFREHLTPNFNSEINIFQEYCKLYGFEEIRGDWSQQTVIDWKEGSALDNYRSRLLQLYPQSSDKVERRINFLIKLVNNFINKRESVVTT